MTVIMAEQVGNRGGKRRLWLQLGFVFVTGIVLCGLAGGHLTIVVIKLTWLAVSRQPGSDLWIEALADRSESMRGYVPNRLATRGAKGVPQLVEALGDENAAKREGAAMALGRIVHYCPD